MTQSVLETLVLIVAVRIVKTIQEHCFYLNVNKSVDVINLEVNTLANSNVFANPFSFPMTIGD